MAKIGKHSRFNKVLNSTNNNQLALLKPGRHEFVSPFISPRSFENSDLKPKQVKFILDIVETASPLDKTNYTWNIDTTPITGTTIDKKEIVMSLVGDEIIGTANVEYSNSDYPDIGLENISINFSTINGLLLKPNTTWLDYPNSLGNDNKITVIENEKSTELVKIINNGSKFLSTGTYTFESPLIDPTTFWKPNGNPMKVKFLLNIKDITPAPPSIQSSDISFVPTLDTTKVKVIEQVFPDGSVAIDGNFIVLRSNFTYEDISTDDTGYPTKYVLSLWAPIGSNWQPVTNWDDPANGIPLINVKRDPMKDNRLMFTIERDYTDHFEGILEFQSALIRGKSVITGDVNNLRVKFILNISKKVPKPFDVNAVKIEESTSSLLGITNTSAKLLGDKIEAYCFIKRDKTLDSNINVFIETNTGTKTLIPYNGKKEYRPGVVNKLTDGANQFFTVRNRDIPLKGGVWHSFDSWLLDSSFVKDAGKIDSNPVSILLNVQRERLPYITNSSIQVTATHVDPSAQDSIDIYHGYVSVIGNYIKINSTISYNDNVIDRRGLSNISVDMQLPKGLILKPYGTWDEFAAYPSSAQYSGLRCHETSSQMSFKGSCGIDPNKDKECVFVSAGIHPDSLDESNGTFMSIIWSVIFKEKPLNVKKFECLKYNDRSSTTGTWVSHSINRQYDTDAETIIEISDYGNYDSYTMRGYVLTLSNGYVIKPKSGSWESSYPSGDFSNQWNGDLRWKRVIGGTNTPKPEGLLVPYSPNPYIQKSGTYTFISEPIHPSSFKYFRTRLQKDSDIIRIKVILKMY